MITWVVVLDATGAGAGDPVLGSAGGVDAGAGTAGVGGVVGGLG
ncbi:MAG: hypothetical protein ACLP0L_16835 [Solirubrobacteraceae bacterium]